MKLRIRFLVLLLFEIVAAKAFSQINEHVRKPDYLAFQTGLMIDRYNSMGIRTFFEYQKDIKGNWQYGISYEHSAHLTSAATDISNSLSTNLSLMSFNGYYKFNLFRDRVFWTTGLGIGGVHANWEDRDKVGATINASMTLNIRITKKLYFESSPLLVLLPSNRVYFSTMDADRYKSFYAFSFFPFGLKVKL